jgi:hypothetical protein
MASAGSLKEHLRKLSRIDRIKHTINDLIEQDRYKDIASVIVENGWEYRGTPYNWAILEMNGAKLPSIRSGKNKEDIQRMYKRLTEIAKSIHDHGSQPGATLPNAYSTDKHGGRRHRQKIMMGRMH